MKIDSSIVAAIISGLAAVVIAFINTNSSFQKIMAELEKHNAVQDQQIQTLTEEVRKHNSVIERTYNCEREIEILKQTKVDK